MQIEAEDIENEYKIEMLIYKYDQAITDEEFKTFYEIPNGDHVKFLIIKQILKIVIFLILQITLMQFYQKIYLMQKSCIHRFGIEIVMNSSN